MIWGQTKPPLGVKINHSHPLSKGIKALWLFNEGYGDKVNDCSGNNYHAKITFPAGEITQWQGSKNGIGIKTQPYNTDIISPINFNPSCFSIEGIISPIIFNNYCPSFFINSGWGSWVLHGDSSGNIYVGTDVSTRFGPVGGFWNINVFVHFVYTINTNGEANIYRNGKLFLGPKTQTKSLMWTVFNINKVGGGGGISEAIFDKFSIYSRDLSAQEVMQLYIEPFAMFND